MFLFSKYSLNNYISKEKSSVRIISKVYKIMWRINLIFVTMCVLAHRKCLGRYLDTIMSVTFCFKYSYIV